MLPFHCYYRFIFLLICLFVHCDRSFVLVHFQTPLSLFAFPCEVNFMVLCRLLLIIVHLLVGCGVGFFVDGICWLLLQRSQTIRSIDLQSNSMGSKAGRLLLEGVKVRSDGNCVC